MVDLDKVRRDAPWHWLKLGWQDMKRAPGISLGYGLIFVAIGSLLTLGLWAVGLASATPVALSGFALVAPALAIGIYQISRALDRGDTPRFRIVISRYPSRLSQIAFLSLILVFLLTAWGRIAQILLVIFVPYGPYEPGPFIEYVLTDPAGLSLLAVGTVVGGVLASAAFAMSALAFPMLVDQDVDAITAMVASFKAVFAQPFVMITWAWLIAFTMAAGSVLFIVGLAITFPWIAHASWHAYKDFNPRPSKPAIAAG